eukprot:9914588-Alexandrium_andersonii.AAC.1
MGEAVVLRVLPGTKWNGPPGLAQQAWLRWVEHGPCHCFPRQPEAERDIAQWCPRHPPMGLYHDAEAGTFKIAEATTDDEREIEAGGSPALATDAHRA